jgi:hypothetical protein
MTTYSKDEYTAYHEILQDFNSPGKWIIRIYSRGPDGKLLGTFQEKSKQAALNTAAARMEKYRNITK